MSYRNSESWQKGSIIVSILVIMIFLSALLLSLMTLTRSNLARARGRIMLLQAQYAAESGADAAIAFLNSGDEAYTGDNDVEVLDSTQYRATYSVSVAEGSDDKEKIITTVGEVYVPSTASTPTYTRTLRVTTTRTSGTTASAMLSRNIIDVDSSVKNIVGKDIYVNGYINLRSNSTKLTAENITVAGKDTGASNCSIEGSGILQKPSSFSEPGQTKTQIVMAYNNCISPPGNTSNSDFDVLANQTNIYKIQSMYIPWSQYMDSSYQDSAGGCNDWTTGSSPRDIPSTGNTKKTHYPDSASNVATSCGTNGDLDLGSDTFIIHDHVHLRAKLCAATACNPTFTNPDSTIKYIFVEGSINFDSIDTSAGSGPIVFVVYGADPGSHGNHCPLGDSIYLSKSGSNGTAAPAAFLLTNNGICLYQTKFDANPALGGMAGKNMYIASNSGNPFDLYLDGNFPVEEIPIDLAWRATRYERL